MLSGREVDSLASLQRRTGLSTLGMELRHHTMQRHGHLVITCRLFFRLFLLRRSPRSGVHENVQQARGSSGTGGGP